MQEFSVRYFVVIILAIIIATVAFVDVGAQGRRRRSRRAAVPARATPSPSPSADTAEPSSPTDPRIVSTADQTTTGTTKTATSRAKASATPAPESEQDQLRHTINDLSGQVNKLTDKLSQMEEQQRSMFDLERLSRAEQRAETFRSQLRDVQDKQTDLQLQIDQVEFAVQPDQIERSLATYGSLHPEVMREQRRKQLENQLNKLKSQMSQFEQSRVRLESAIATSDAEVEKLQRQIEVSNQQTGQPGIVVPKPSPVETPPDRPPLF
jgi:predicted  nucleic acid-binding Zn-ribbon protein